VIKIVRLLSGAALVLAFATGATPALQTTTSLALQPTSATGSYLAGRQALGDMRTDDAASYFHSASAVDWDNPVIVERTFVAYAANGQIKESADTVRHLIELGVQNDLGSVVLGTEDLKQKRYAAAIEDLDKVSGDSFAGITGSIVKAWALVGEDKLDDAMKVLDGIGQGDLEDFLVFHRALMAEVAGDSERALDLAGKAYDANVNVERIAEAYARMLGNAGRFDEAEKVIDGFEAQGLDHPLLDPVKEAIAAHRRPGVFAGTVQEGAAETFHSIGAALSREGAPEVAAVFLRLGMYLAPKADVITMLYAQLLDDKGQREAANRLYSGIAEGSPLKASAVVRVAENVDAMGNHDEALRQLGNIVAANPRDLDALSVLGDLQRTAKKYAEAAATYSRLIAGSDKGTDALWRYFYVRGIAYERNNEWPKAEADFEHALELNPDQPQVLNYLGYSWVDQGVNLDKALGMIKKAVDASPNDGYIVDSLGWAYYRLGQIDDAVTALEQAVQLRSTDPEINDHLGDAYWRAGRTLEAKFQWNIAASVDTEGDVKARVAKKLADGLPPLPDHQAPKATTTQAQAEPVKP
jgi:tetratricopeptide (TPR) repeat protein